MAERADIDPIQTQREVWLRACAAHKEREAERDAGFLRLNRDVERALARRDEEHATLLALISAEKEKFDKYLEPPSAPATPEDVAAIERGDVFGLASDEAAPEADPQPDAGVVPAVGEGRYIGLRTADAGGLAP
jgi:hypothetical protein